MDEFWAVVWGASIALIASVVGGLLTSVVGPWLSRRADKADREQQAAAVARESVRAALQDISIGMNSALFAMGRDDQEALKVAQYAVNRAQITLRMWTSHEERDVELAVYSVMGTEEVNDAVLAVSAWEDVAARWFRGVLHPKNFMNEFEESLERRAPLAEQWRAEQRARDAGPTPGLGQ